jgi:hypothetical protein
VSEIPVPAAAPAGDADEVRKLHNATYVALTQDARYQHGLMRVTPDASVDDAYEDRKLHITTYVATTQDARYQHEFMLDATDIYEQSDLISLNMRIRPKPPHLRPPPILQTARMKGQPIKRICYPRHNLEKQQASPATAATATSEGARRSREETGDDDDDSS